MSPQHRCSAMSSDTPSASEQAFGRRPRAIAVEVPGWDSGWVKHRRRKKVLETSGGGSRVRRRLRRRAPLAQSSRPVETP
jgi:hypothetical protein